MNGPLDQVFDVEDIARIRRQDERFLQARAIENGYLQLLDDWADGPAPLYYGSVALYVEHDSYRELKANVEIDSLKGFLLEELERRAELYNCDRLGAVGADEAASLTISHVDIVPKDPTAESRSGQAETTELRNLIARTEDDQLEFKSSVIWNVGANRHDLVMRDEVLKEICALLNADGGTILCGVKEKADGTGELVGLAKDLKHQGNPEKLCRVISNAMGDLVKPDPGELVSVKSVVIDGQDILRIVVKSDPANMYQSPAIPKGNQPGGKPTTHVRVNGEAKAFDGQALINWWDRRKRGDVA